MKFEEFRDFNSNLISTTVKDKVVKLFAYLSFWKNKASVRVYVRTRGPVTAPGSNGGIEPSGVGVVGGWKRQKSTNQSILAIFGQNTENKLQTKKIPGEENYKRNENKKVSK